MQLKPRGAAARRQRAGLGANMLEIKEHREGNVSGKYLTVRVQERGGVGGVRALDRRFSRQGVASIARAVLMFCATASHAVTRTRKYSGPSLPRAQHPRNSSLS